MLPTCSERCSRSSRASDGPHHDGCTSCCLARGPCEAHAHRVGAHSPPHVLRQCAGAHRFLRQGFRIS